MKYQPKRLYSGIFGLVMGALAVTAQAEQIGMETASSHSVVGILPQTMASYWSKAGVDVQLAMGQTLTKSLLKVARGTLDSAVVPPLAYTDLSQGKGPYAGLGKRASDSAGNVRTLFAFPGSVFQPIVWADSGIKTWHDAVGKRVYIGPPAGVANAQIEEILAAGGLKQNQYLPVKVPWGAATQGFQDGQYDVYIGAFGRNSQALAELSLTRKIRLLSLPEDKMEPPKGEGLISATLSHKSYPGLVNKKDIRAWQTVMLMTVNKKMSDDTAYRLTKTYMEHRKALVQNNALLTDILSTNPLAGVNVPLHPGAVRYYKEAGIKIPDELLPH